MSKGLKIAISLAVVVALVILVYLFDKSRFDDTIAYSKDSYAPYSTKFFYENLKKTNKSLTENKSIFDTTLATDSKANQKVLMIVGKYFQPNKYEFDKLIEFMNRGGTVFISSFSYNGEFLNYAFGVPHPPTEYEGDSAEIDSTKVDDSTKMLDDSISDQIENDSVTSIIDSAAATIEDDSIELKNQFSIEYENTFPPKPNRYRLSVQLSSDSLKPIIYTYPGRKTTSFITKGKIENSKVIAQFHDTQFSAIIQKKYENGSLIINQSPLTLSNYFLLYQNNYEYWQKLQNELNLKEKHIIWDNFYKDKRYRYFYDEPNFDKDDSYFKDLMDQNPALKWAVYLFGLFSTIFLFNNIARVQKPIPTLPIIKNQSKNLAELLSGIFWQKNDNLNIAKKLFAQFYQHLLYQYRIQNTEIHLQNIEFLSQKTGINQGVFTKLLTIEKNLEAELKGNNNLNLKISDGTLQNIYQLTHQVIHKTK